MTSRACVFVKESGESCRSAPMHDHAFCFWHSPDHADEAREARRLGGLRRGREATISGAYEFDGLDNVEGIRRVLVIATVDTLAQPNSNQRSRALGYLTQVALRSLEVGEFEKRLTAIEAALGQRLRAWKRK